MATKTELAWAAGVVDGEGCILIYQAHTNTGEAWVIRLIVSNTDKKMILRLQKIFGIGNLTFTGRRKAGYKDIWRYEVAAKKAEIVLRLLKPYLVTKQTEARIAVESRKLIRQHGINTPNPNFSRLATIKKQLERLKRTQDT